MGPIAVRCLVTAVATAGLLGCSTVRPYERGALAHPTMQTDYGKTDAERHMQAVHEGPEGGDQGAVSGCGCN